MAGVAHRFHSTCGKNVTLEEDGTRAVRAAGYAHGLVFSTKELKPEEVFEVGAGPSALGPGCRPSAPRARGSGCAVSPSGEGGGAGREVGGLPAARADHAGARGDGARCRRGPGAAPLPPGAPDEDHLDGVQL